MKRKSLFTLLSALALIILTAGSAFAFTAPTEGAMFYEVYDLVINSILAGPVGFVIGALMVIGGIFLLVQGRGFLLPLICLIGGVILVKVDAIVTSFGFSMDAVMGAMMNAAKTVGNFLM